MGQPAEIRNRISFAKRIRMCFWGVKAKRLRRQEVAWYLSRDLQVPNAFVQ